MIENFPILCYFHGRTPHTRPLPFATYPDGTPWVKVPSDFEAIEHVDALLCRPRHIVDFLTCMWFVDALRARGLCIPHLVLPCMPGQRQDRLLRDREADMLFTAKSVADMINARQFPTVTMLDPHSMVSVALVERVRWFVPLAAQMGSVFGTYAGVIAPDSGATARARDWSLALNVPAFQAWKHRDPTTGALTGFGYEPLKPGHYLIVDDICDGGGTFVGLQHQIQSDTGGKVTLDLYTTHGFYTKGAKGLRTIFKRVICTDSTLGPHPDGVAVVPICWSLLTSLFSPA